MVLISRYLDDLLNIDNSCFEQKVSKIYPAEFQLNKKCYVDTEAHLLFYVPPIVCWGSVLVFVLV